MNSKLMQVSQGRLSVVRLFAFVLTLVGVLSVQMPAGVAQAAPAVAPSATYNYEAELECWVYMPDEVYIGEDFEVEVEVSNVSDVNAKNVTVYVKANPSGYFDVNSCHPNCRGVSASLGRIKAWQSKMASYDITAPDEKGYFTFDFYADAHNAEQTYCGSYDFAVFGEEVGDDGSVILAEPTEEDEDEEE